MGMKLGATAKLKQPTIQGKIESTKYNEEREELEHLLVWKDENGEEASRWFLASELEEV